MNALSGKPVGSSTQDRRGSALIIVLVCLVLVSTLSVAFLVSMRSKVVLSKSGSDSGKVRMLAETAVNIPISQIRDATVKAGKNSMAWASQPGMIRLYDNTGAPAGYYKLYSADNLVSTNGAFQPASDAVPANWADKPASYTDLNAPANGVFPILDYAAAQAHSMPGLTLGTVPGSSTSRPAPMPVKWLYLLKDGSLHSPSPASTGLKAIIPAATTGNPIVGRIAFWADDESCKVNVNTASEGTFWATPRFNTTGDRLLASSQPARGEFQRYPGHPATVSLKPLFPSLSSEQIFSIAPRLSAGGSEGGTKPVQNVSNWITTDMDRLYASLDEVLFKIPTSSGRTVQDGLEREAVEAARFLLTANSRVPELNLFGLPRIATWPLHEVNDNNHRTVNDRLIAFCGTLGGPPPAATYPFYFTRQENVLPTHDISLPRNTQLLDYLDRLTGEPIPGFGNTFEGKYTQPETRQILTEIYDYIRCTNLLDYTTPQNPPGSWPYAFALSTRSPKGVMDLGAGSSFGQAVPARHPTWNTYGFGGRFLQVMEAHLHFVGLGMGESDSGGNAVPVHSDQIGVRQTMPSGASWNGNTPPEDTLAIQAYLYFSTLTPGEGIELWCPGQWFQVQGLETFSVAVEKSANVDVYSPLGFPASDVVTIMGNMLGGGGVTGARVHALDTKGFTQAQNTGKVFNLSIADKRRRFPFYSAIVPVNLKEMVNASGTPVLKFSGGTIQVKLFADRKWQNTSQAVGEEVESFSITFPPGDFPMPKLAEMRRIGTGVVPADSTTPDKARDDRWMLHPNLSAPWIIEADNDVMRSMSISHGDIRLLQGAGSSATFFAPTPGYTDFSLRISHSIPGIGVAQMGNGKHGVRGKLIQGAPHPLNSVTAPFVHAGIDGAPTVGGFLGDWDNGTATVGDGPFINAPDPGSVSPVTSTVPPYFDNSSTTASKSGTFFSPNRLLPGPGMFGSLSTGAQRALPWQTLLFRPGPPDHPGSAGPFDHLLLDLFWMPIVEPYAISEPFSTAGKINMNQQLVPFTYINRTAGLRAALASEQVAMVKKSEANKYKSGSGGAVGLANSRVSLNLSEANGTLRQFKDKFDSGEIFRSATEICDIYLVPEGQSWTTDTEAQTAWYGDDFAMVGDNTRERPYAHLYNKLSTKSNTFTVHYQAQVLQQTRASLQADPTVFDPALGDKVTAEQRGATTFERYLDPADPRIVAEDPASADATSLEQFYRTRILNTSIFNP